MARLGLAYGALLTLPGLPVVYYGDEVGLGQSANHTRADTHQDRWFREPMPWNTERWDHDLHGLVARLARLRTTTPALYVGDYVSLVTEGEALVFERVADHDRVLVVLAVGDGPWATTTGEVVADLAEDGLTLRDLLDETAAPLGADDELRVTGPGVGVWRIATD